MNKEWKNYKLGELCETISITHKFNKNKLVFLNTGDIDRGKFLHSKYTAIKDMPGQAKKTIKKNDILFSEIRPANGRYAFLSFASDDYVVSTKLMVIRCREAILPKYLYQFITSKTITDWLQHLAESRSGTFPQITFDQVADIEINLPSKVEQKTISEFLSALDDKIELNRQTNQTLEAIAQAIFKEWFVDFNFPGTTGEMQDSELGQIPKGWRVGKLGEVVAVQNGYAFKSNDFKDAGEIKIIKIKNISGNLVDVVSTQFVDREIVEKLDKKYKIEIGSLLIAMTGAEVGKIGLIPKSEKQLWLNQRVGMFVEKVKYANHFIYILLGSEEYQNTLQNSALGSAQPNISSSVIENISTIMPPVKVILNFGELVNPLFERILSNYDESATLTAIRDSLLPELMNGETEV